MFAATCPDAVTFLVLSQSAAALDAFCRETFDQSRSCCHHFADVG